MNKKVFLQWVGRTAIKDLLFPNEAKAKPPAIIEAHKNFGFDEIVLLGNVDPEKRDVFIINGEEQNLYLYKLDWFEKYKAEILKRCKCRVYLHTIDEGATDLITIYKKTNSILKNYNNQATFYYDTNSGTTAMTVNWYFLWSQYKGHLLETKLPEHTRQKYDIIVREMNVPFEFVAEFIPEQAMKDFLEEDIVESEEFKKILGQSKELIDVKKLAQKVAPFSPNVIIQGESGTGKELFASALHNAIQTARGDDNIPFVTINCGAIPFNLIEAELFGVEKGAYTGANRRRDGVFQRANGGVLFLDEIGDLPLEAQVKLLRAIPTLSKDGEIYRVGSREPENIKLNIIAATHKDLQTLIRQGKFREDLFYRLATIFLEIPPLRERKGDIDLLVNSLLQTWCKKYKLDKTLDKPAMNALKSHSWRGNIRELETTIKRLLITTKKKSITDSDVKNALFNFDELEETVESCPLEKFSEVKREFEKKFILRALKQANGNITAASKLLKMERKTLSNRVKKLRIEIEKSVK